MTLNFQRKPGPPSAFAPSGRRRPPPNYFSRGVQFRLFMLIAGLMLVAMLVQRVRDPKFWHFMGFTERPIAGGPPLADHELAPQDLDTRLRLAPGAHDESGAEVVTLPAATNVATTPARATSDENTSGGDAQRPAESDTPQPADDPQLVEAEADAWHQVLSQLDGDEQLLLYDGLDRRIANQQLDASEAEAWTSLVDRLGELWERHCQKATTTLDSVPAEERATWMRLIGRLRATWADRWFSPLSHVVASENATSEPADAATARRLRDTLDAVVVEAIQDDTVTRDAERAVWFRWLSRLRETDNDALRRESAGPTGFLQLYKQPKDYRGKVVTVRGVAHLAYYVEAPPNRTNIPGYYMFWVRPAGGPNSPFVIYSLSVPPGFPKLSKRDEQGERNKLNEEVEFTGLFFKRWAYRGEGGIFTAPLLFAREPRWQPPAVAPDADSGPTAGTIVLIVLTALAVGGGGAVYVFKRT
ncbi:MAG TPA: hypothetical protein PLV92_06720 [Pirellulaceae bacterium]|nr:hypothetical protein [Pirellulaceae bacterium]